MTTANIFTLQAKPEADPFTTDPAILLEAHICDQRRSYLVGFASEAQALIWASAHMKTHAIHELEERPIPSRYDALLDWLYPTCEHGLSADNCYGFDHYAQDWQL